MDKIIRQIVVVRVSVVLRNTVWGDIDWRFDNLSGSHHQSQVTDSDDDFRSGCRNVSQCHLKQSFSGLYSPGRSQFAELWSDSWGPFLETPDNFPGPKTILGAQFSAIVIIDFES